MRLEMEVILIKYGREKITKRRSSTIYDSGTI